MSQKVWPYQSKSQDLANFFNLEGLMDQEAHEDPFEGFVPDNNVENVETGTVETGTVFMANGEKRVVNISDFEASLDPEYGIVLMPNGERWVVNIAMFEAAKGCSPRRSGFILAT